MKHVIGFVIFSDFFKENEELFIKESVYKKIELPGGKFPLIYADKLSVSKGKWKIIDNIPLNDLDRKLIIHNYAGNLYNGDEKIRELTTEELKNEVYHKMVVSGNIFVERLLCLMHEVRSLESYL